MQLVHIGQTGRGVGVSCLATRGVIEAALLWCRQARVRVWPGHCRGTAEPAVWNSLEGQWDGAGERTAHQRRAGTEDRSEGQRVNRRSFTARLLERFWRWRMPCW